MKATAKDNSSKSEVMYLVGERFYMYSFIDSVSVHSVSDEKEVRAYDSFDIFFDNVYSDMDNGDADIDKEYYFCINGSAAKFAISESNWEGFLSETMDILTFLSRCKLQPSLPDSQKEELTISRNGEQIPLQTVTMNDIATGAVDLCEELVMIAQSVCNAEGLEPLFELYKTITLRSNPVSADLVDCVYDFRYSFETTNLRVSRHYKRLFFGLDTEERMEQCFRYMTKDVETRKLDSVSDVSENCSCYEGQSFTWIGHYTFDKGRIDFNEMLSWLEENKKGE